MTVIFSKTIAGERYDVTREAILNHPMLDDILSHAVHRIANSARTNAEDKDAAEAARLADLIAGKEWRQGGGGALSEEDRLYRTHLAAWAATHANYKRAEADKLARKDGDKLLSETARAILKKKGESVSKDRVSQGAENLRQRIMRDVAAAMQDAEI